MTIIQIRRDTAANWTTINTILSSGEQGLETDTRKRKTGDGVTAWASLAYEATAASVAANTTAIAAGNGRALAYSIALGG